MGCALGDHVTTICFSSSAISTLASHLPRLYTPHPCLPRPPPWPAMLPPLATPPTAHPHHTTPSSTNLNWRRTTATFTPVTSSSQPIVSHHPLGGAPAVLLAVLNLPPPPGRPLPLAPPPSKIAGHGNPLKLVTLASASLSPTAVAAEKGRQWAHGLQRAGLIGHGGMRPVA